MLGLSRRMCNGWAILVYGHTNCLYVLMRCLKGVDSGNASMLSRGGLIR